jgi:hypothetical protein
VALSGQVINLIGLKSIEKPDEVCRIGDVAVMQEQPNAVDIGILVERVDSTGVESRGPADDAMNLVPLRQ